MFLRIAKQKCEENQDLYLEKCMKDEMGRPLSEENDIKQKWKTYFEKLMNENIKRKDRKMTKANRKEVERITK